MTELITTVEAARRAGITPAHARRLVGRYLAANKARKWPQKIGRDWMAAAAVWETVLNCQPPRYRGGRPRKAPASPVDQTRSAE